MYSTQKKMTNKNKTNKQNTKQRKKNSRNLKKKYLCSWMKFVGVPSSSYTRTIEWEGVPIDKAYQ
jgi:hypothetical protein